MAADYLSATHLSTATAGRPVPVPLVAGALPVLPGMTIAEAVEAFGPPASVAFFVTVDGGPVLRANWHRVPAAGEQLGVVVLPRGGGDGKSILGLVAMIALAAFAPWAGGALAGLIGMGGNALVAGAIGSVILAGGGILINTLLAPKPAAAAADQLEASPTYSASASGNQARLFAPIPVQYGEHLMVPDYVSDPYQEFSGNDQYLHLLFGRGLGRSEVSQVRIGETVVWTAEGGNTGALADLEIAFYEPGEQVDLFPVQVETSAEVGGQLLADSTWVGPFAAVPSGETAHRLSVDIVLPEGCYRLTDDGSQASASVHLRFEYREIDGLGAPVGGGAWSLLAEDTITLTTATPQRLTWSLDVAPARYEVRAQRLNLWAADDRIFDRSEWAGLRAYLDGPQSFEHLSTMAIRVRANEQLTSQSSRQFAVVQTRILPVWTGTAWEEQPTRSIAWAAVDIARNAIYGAGLLDARLDLATFIAYDALWEARGDRFDGIFDTRTTRFDAISTVLGAGRASVQFVGDKVSLVRDEPRALASQVFTDRNIVRGSLEIDYSLQRSDAADDVIVEYMDRTTWKPAEVRCTIAQSLSEAPARVRMIGPTARDHAWREGIFLAADNFFRRVKVTFRAEMEGRLLKRGDLVLVQSEMPQSWGEAGTVLGLDGDTVTLSREPSTDPANTYLRIRRKDGGEWGPCKITWAPGSAVVTLDAADRAAAEAAFGPLAPHVVDDGDEAPTWLVGEGVDQHFRGILVGMVPDDTGAQLELIVDDPAVHAADQGLTVPPAPLPGLLPPSLGVPVITDMSVHREVSVTESLLSVSARHPAGATSFRGQVSYDGQSWTPVYEGAVPAFSASVRRDALYVRMQPIGQLPGPWEVRLVAAAPAEVRFPEGATVTATDLYNAAMAEVVPASETLGDLRSSIYEQLHRITTEAGLLGAIIDTQQRESVRTTARFTETLLLIANEEQARVQATTTLEATFTAELSTRATITYVDDAVATEAGARATAISAVSSTVADLTSDVTVLAEAIDGVEARYGVAVQVGGVVGGFTITGLQPLDGSPVVDFGIQADRFWIVNPSDTGQAQQPFLFVGGVLYVNEAVIPTLSANLIRTGRLESNDGQMFIDFDDPEIVMQSISP